MCGGGAGIHRSFGNKDGNSAVYERSSPKYKEGQTGGAHGFGLRSRFEQGAWDNPLHEGSFREQNIAAEPSGDTERDLREGQSGAVPLRSEWGLEVGFSYWRFQKICAERHFRMCTIITAMESDFPSFVRSSFPPQSWKAFWN